MQKIAEVLDGARGRGRTQKMLVEAIASFMGHNTRTLVVCLNEQAIEYTVKLFKDLLPDEDDLMPLNRPNSKEREYQSKQRASKIKFVTMYSTHISYGPTWTPRILTSLGRPDKICTDHAVAEHIIRTWNELIPEPDPE